MWVRSILKARAKENVKRSYWACVIACAILLICSAIFCGIKTEGKKTNHGGTLQWRVLESTGFNDFYSAFEVNNVSAKPVFQWFVFQISVIAFVILAVIAVFASIFLFGPLEVGLNRFFMKNRQEDGQVRWMFEPFQNKAYFHVVWVMFLRELFVVLWSCLFLIPGIIKAYEYRMVSYILSENPEMEREKVFLLSKQMMKGQKWKAFVLDLSFILWYGLAAIIPLRLLNIFYLDPYVYATNAELYSVLREEAIQNNYIYSSELNGFI